MATHPPYSAFCEGFMRAVGEPAQALTIPPPPSEPPDPAQLATIAAEYGQEILGPPGIPAPAA
jgi:hypothetical protein